MILPEPFDILIEGKKIPWRKTNTAGVSGALPKYVYITYNGDGAIRGYEAKVDRNHRYRTTDVHDAIAYVVKHIEHSIWYERHIKVVDSSAREGCSKTGLQGIYLGYGRLYPNLLRGGLVLLNNVYSMSVTNLNHTKERSKADYVHNLARLYVIREYLKILIKENMLVNLPNSKNVDITYSDIPTKFANEKYKEGVKLVDTDYYEYRYNAYRKYLNNTTMIVSGKRLKVTEHFIGNKFVKVPKGISILYRKSGNKYRVTVDGRPKVCGSFEEAMYLLEYTILARKMVDA